MLGKLAHPDARQVYAQEGKVKIMKTRVTTHAPLHGDVAPGFEAVQTAFARNFTERGELGGACTIYYQGEKVVDLWGGYRDPHKTLPWQEDTIVLVFSSTKGLAGLTMALAHSRSLFEYDAPIASYWPEFAQNGKGHITVRQLLAHEAGLSSIDEPLPPAVLANPDVLATILARATPAWEPGTRHGYHAFTSGGTRARSFAVLIHNIARLVSFFTTSWPDR